MRPCGRAADHIGGVIISMKRHRLDGRRSYAEKDVMITSRKSFWSKLDCLTQWIAILAVMHYCFYRFFSSTRFRFTYDFQFKEITYAMLVCLGVTRLLIGFGKEFYKAEGRKAKLLTLVKPGLAALSVIPCMMITKQFQYVFAIYLPFAAMCLYGADWRRVMQVFTCCIGTMLAVTVLCALSGSIENLVYPGHGRRGTIRTAYGICYPTDFATYLIYLFVFLWSVRRKKSTGQTLAFAGGALLIAWFVYTYPHSETSTFCGILIAVLVLYEGLGRDFLAKHKGSGWINKVIDFLTVWAFPILAVIILVAAWLYGQGNAFAVQMNEWMSRRLEWTWQHYQAYGIRAFGAATPQSGWGGTVVKAAADSYEFLDSTYALLPIRYGWVFAAGVAAIWVSTTWRAMKHGHRKLALAMAVIAFHSFSEHHLPEVNYNILLVMPLCCYAGMKAAEKTAEEKQQAAAGWIAGAAVAGIGILLLPKALSWTRALFAIRNWTGGGDRSLRAMFFWLAAVLVCFLIFWLLRRAILRGMERKRPEWKSAAALGAAICAAVGGVIWVNGQITGALPRYENRIAEDREAVEQILSSAAEPVYAGQTEEIYKRNFSGISDRIFSEEELAREGRGTILTEHDLEGYQLFNTGAMFTEISPYTGLYTYDDAVISAMLEKGYQFHNYYSAERKENLASFAKRNRLKATSEGALILQGKDHPLFAGPYINQFAGEYTVTYTLQLLDDLAADGGGDREVCELCVSAMWYQDVRVRRPVYLSEFDVDGHAVISVDYNVDDVYAVEFKVYTRDEVRMLVEQITWKEDGPEVDQQNDPGGSAGHIPDAVPLSHRQKAGAD